MRRLNISLRLTLALALLWSAPCFGQMTTLGAGSTKAPAATGCTQATNFLTRANGVTTLDATHTTAYTNLICGLVTDGVITGTLGGSGVGASACGSKLDILYIFATQSRGVAKLNLCSTSFTITESGSGTFTADRGFVITATTDILDTNYNSTTAGGAYTQNAAHLMVWDSTSANGDGASQIAVNSASNQHIYARFSDTNAYFRINSNSTGAAVANAHGFYIGNRSGASAWQGYKNGSSIATGTDASGAPGNADLMLPAGTSSGQTNSTDQLSAGGAGGNLSSTDVGNYNTRMLAFMNAVGLPGAP